MPVRQLSTLSGTAHDASMSAFDLPSVLKGRRQNDEGRPRGTDRDRGRERSSVNVAVMPWLAKLVSFHESLGNAPPSATRYSLAGSSGDNSSPSEQSRGSPLPAKSLGYIQSEPLLELLQHITEEGFDVEQLDSMTHSQTLVCLGIHCCYRFARSRETLPHESLEESLVQ